MCRSCLNRFRLLPSGMLGDPPETVTRETSVGSFVYLVCLVEQD